MLQLLLDTFDVVTPKSMYHILAIVLSRPFGNYVHATFAINTSHSIRIILTPYELWCIPKHHRPDFMLKASSMQQVWNHKMSALLTLCERNAMVNGRFPNEMTIGAESVQMQWHRHDARFHACYLAIPYRWALHPSDNHQRMIHAFCLVKICALYICWK